MKFLSWLFDFADRHLGDARRYERGGTASRILLVIFLALMSAGSIGIEFWGFELFKTSGIGGFFVLLSRRGSDLRRSIYSFFTPISGFRERRRVLWISFLRKARQKRKANQPDTSLPKRHRTYRKVSTYSSEYSRSSAFSH